MGGSWLALPSAAGRSMSNILVWGTSTGATSFVEKGSTDVVDLLQIFRSVPGTLGTSDFFTKQTKNMTIIIIRLTPPIMLPTIIHV